MIARYGDRAADWVWRNKGAILVASTAAAFVSNPEGFLRGTSQPVGMATQPVTQAVSTHLGSFIVGVGVALTGAVVVWIMLKRGVRAALQFIRTGRTPLDRQRVSSESGSSTGEAS